MPLRSYDPAIARWTTIDPVTHHSQSTYTGYDNNPVFWADPSGADVEQIAGGTRYTGVDAQNMFRQLQSQFGGSSNNSDSSSGNSNSSGTDSGSSSTNGNGDSDSGGDNPCYRCDLEFKIALYNVKIDIARLQGADKAEIRKLIRRRGAYMAMLSDHKVSDLVAPKDPLGIVLHFGTLGILSKWGVGLSALRNTGKYANYGFRSLDNIADVSGRSGLYIFDDATRGLQPYVGISQDLATRLTTHFNAGRIGGQIYFKPLTGSRTFLEVSETIMINNLGGLRGTANMRLPVSMFRNNKLGLGISNYIPK